jgi:hypothetical protein
MTDSSTTRTAQETHYQPIPVGADNTQFTLIPSLAQMASYSNYPTRHQNEPKQLQWNQVSWQSGFYNSFSFTVMVKVLFMAQQFELM